MKVKTRVISVLTAVVAVHVVAVPKARCQSTVTTELFRHSVHCRSGWSVAMNNDRSYRHHWFYSIDHSRGQRSIRYRFESFSRIQKLLGRTERRTRDRMYLGRIRSVRDISRDDRARIATCSLRTPTDRLMENYSSIDCMLSGYACTHATKDRTPLVFFYYTYSKTNIL